MSKRRISKQQSIRIDDKHSRYRQSKDNPTPTSSLDGLVIARFSRHALIETAIGSLVLCSIRPSIDTLVAGDRIVFEPEGPTQGAVVSCYPRDSVLGRPDKRGHLKPIAANITQLIIVVATKPDLSWPLLDSYLVMAEYLHLKATIIFNKIDLDSQSLQQQLLQHYEPLGYPLLFTCQANKKTLTPLQDLLADEVSVFVGQSGVGKSSLIAGLLPQERAIQTNDISLRTALGKHTTRNSRLYHIPSGGALIDSPGVRELSLWHMPITDIANGFREFKPFLSHCKFRNCNHHFTLGCAVLDAVNKHQISHTRYENYVKIALQFSI